MALSLVARIALLPGWLACLDLSLRLELPLQNRMHTHRSMDVKARCMDQSFSANVCSKLDNLLCKLFKPLS